MESSKKELIAKLDTLHSSKFLCSALLKLHSDEAILFQLPIPRIIFIKATSKR
ncbi:hypothetical protein AAZX31_07G159700 [Glycine max]